MGRKPTGKCSCAGMVQSPEAGGEGLDEKQRLCHLVFECEKCDSKAMILEIHTNNGTGKIYSTHILILKGVHKTQRKHELLL